MMLLCGCVSSHEIDDFNGTQIEDNNFDNVSSIISADSSLNELNSAESDEIIVNDWDELQYYCSLEDKDYTLRLKENTNFYPSSPTDSNNQIKINNNVKIIGSNGSYIGDSSFHKCYIPSDGTHYIVEGGQFVKYTPIVVPDGNRKSLTLENITFKWIYLQYSPDAKFLQLGGGGNYIIKNCHFDYINTVNGDGAVILLKKGKATLDNCSFVNSKVPKGFITVSELQSMTVKDCYFANNFAYVHTTCIMNWGKVTIYNTKFYKNRSAAWAGGITTYGQGNTTIYNCNFTDNVAGWNGGALYVYNIVNIYNTTFEGNNCTTNNGGGAIGACQFSGIPRLYVEGCLFKENNNNCWALDELSTDGTGRGGAISFMDVGTIDVRNSVFIANSASIATAICAWEAGSYGSPDIYIINNTFINHTRAGDVLNVKVKGTVCNVSGNRYIGNSIEFSDLTLSSISTSNEQATFKVNAELLHPNYYESDILDRTSYDVYINNRYVKTVNTTEFTIDFGDLDICNVYVIPTISNQKTNEVTVTSTREYVFVSGRGSDTNSGSSRDAPVKSLTKALELAQNCQNIILLDGIYSEDVNINYAVTIKGENNATLTNTSAFNVNANLTLKNLKINKLNTDNFIKGSNVVISNCIFESNTASALLDTQLADISKSIFINNNALIVKNKGFASIKDSIILNNTNVIQGSSNYSLDNNWWGNTLDDLNKPNDLNINRWIVLNATSNAYKLENNHKAQVQFGFYLNNAKYLSLPEIDLTLTSVNGAVNTNTTSADSKVTFTLTGFSNASLIAEYNNIKTTLNYEFLKSNPNINVKSEDIMFGDELVIQVSTPNDCEGNITVTVGNITKTSEISNNVFNFTNIKAGNYLVNVSYSGDKKYYSQIRTVNVNVNKYPSNTDINLSEINVNEDLFIRITVPDDATGNVSLYINGQIQTLSLTDAKANFTIKNIARGDYIIKAVYNGDNKYLESRDTIKIEVDNINSSMEISANDIVYGETAIINVKLNENATGNVSVTVDGVTNMSCIVNGQATIILNNIEAGIKNITVFYTGDDTYFNKTETGHFTISKADLTFDISSENIKIGKDAIIRIKVPAKTSGTFTIGDDTIVIPLSGSIEYAIKDLEIGEYEITAVYNGNNYNTVVNSTSFRVLEYPAPQWANDGADSKNTDKSIYESVSNGNIKFIINIPGEIVGGLTIDSEGNIYITTGDVIYSYDNNGTLRYLFAPDTREGNFSGTTIGRDVVITPKSGDTLYFINQTTGEKYGSSNIYQGSSTFSPIIDSNANIYIVSEYQVTAGRYNLVKIPYSMWEFGGNPILVSLDKSAPLSAPTVGEDIVVVLSENRLRVIDANSLKSLFIKSGDFKNIRPVIGDGNIVYVILGDSIVAYSISGSQLWKTKITGGAGNQLLMDPEIGLYATNANGNLYRYDLVTGKESLVSSLKITSDVLIESNNNLFFGCENLFYEITPEGNVLWKSDLGSNITGSPVMSMDGTIYVTSEDNKVFALTHADLKDPNLKAEFKDNTLTVTLDNQTTGMVSFTLNGVKYDEAIVDGKLTRTILDLKAGSYNVDVIYSGDLRFNASSVMVSFIIKGAPQVNVPASSGNDVTISLPSDATGNVTVEANGKTYTKTLVNGKATFTLPEGNYKAVITYSGDNVYEAFTITKEISIKNPVVKKASKITAKKKTFKKSLKVKKYTVTLKAGKTPIKKVKLIIKMGRKTFKAKTNAKGKATFKIKKLTKKGRYTAKITFKGNAYYKATSKKVKIVLK
jgi:hypothetical protein